MFHGHSQDPQRSTAAVLQAAAAARAAQGDEGDEGDSDVGRCEMVRNDPGFGDVVGYRLVN